MNRLKEEEEPMSLKAELIRKVLDIEWEMFQSVPVVERTRCQEHREPFDLVRGSMFRTWTEDTLESYHSDLIEARSQPHNFMALKYARMDNLIPSIKENPRINEIIGIESKWQTEVSAKYPHLIILGQTSGYCGDEDTACHVTAEVYRRCELETFSDFTIEHLYQDICEALNEGRNLAEESYAYIVEGMGYISLDEVEEKAKKASDKR